MKTTMLKRYGKFAFPLALLALPFVLGSPYLLQVAIITILFAYLGLAWNLVGGLAGQVSFGHTIFLGIGAYTPALLFIRWEISPWIGMLVGGGLAVIASVIMGWPCFRLRGAYFSLASLALATATTILMTNTNEFAGFDFRGAAGITVPPRGNAPHLFQFTGKMEYYYIALAFLLMMWLVDRAVRNSRIGLFLRAVAEEEEAVKSLGVDVTRQKSLVLAISAFFTALGGAFYVQLIRFVDPQSGFGFDRALEIVLMSTVGGIRYPAGPIVGAFILQPVNEIVRIYLGGSYIGVHRAVYGLALLLVIRFLPGGLCSLPERVGQAWTRSRARRSKQVASGTEVTA